MHQRDLRNIVYFCIPENRPTGGIKYLLRHSNLINSMPEYGVASAIHIPDSPDFQPNWEVPHILKRDDSFNRFTDLVVLPEIMVEDVAPVLQENQVRYAILAQNGFYVAQGRAEISHFAALYSGAVSIVSTSAEITKTLRAIFSGISTPIFNVNYAFDPSVFSPGTSKRNLVTYMPRKLTYHGQQVLRYLRTRNLRGWHVQPIDGLGEAGVVELLKSSKIFLSFSDMEGFGLPPVEAALLGNRVIGYTGIGGREYFNPPLFEQIEHGDILEYALAVEREIARQTEYAGTVPGEFAAQIADLANTYSPANELRALKIFVEHAVQSFARA
jgi:hypothetical protein